MMMKTAIMTDTNSGVTIEEARQRGLYVLPMPVIIDGNDYLEGIDVTHADLYTAMRAGKDIHSSQPAPGDFIDMWKHILEEGYDELVYIPMSAGLSGSYETACSFANAWSGQVFVVNNRRISVTLYESVLEALHMAQQGMNAVAIKTSLEAHAADSSIYITVNTLEYLKRSGRVTPAGAAIAEILSLKPVLTIQGGKLDAYAKVRGMKNSQKRMIAATADDLARRFANFHPGQIRIGAAGTFENPDDAQRWTQQLAEAFPQYQVYYQPLSCSIACHVGIDAAGLGISCLQP